MRASIMLFGFVAMGVCAAELGPVKIQRRNDVEFSHGALNDQGELTYTIAGNGTSVLTLGSAEGNAVVSDPFAIRLAPQRILSAGEWAATLGDGVTLNEQGVYEFFDAYKTGDTVRSMTIAPVNSLVKIARVTYGINNYFINNKVAQTEESVSWSGTSTYNSFLDPYDKGAWMYVSNIVVYAWVGDERISSVDFTLSDLSVTDKTGTYNMSDLRQWIKTRYDSKTGDQWSKFPATQAVNLSDNQIWFDPLGIVRMSSWQSADTNTVAITVNGTPVLEIVPGATEFSDQLKIVDYQINGSTQAVFYVSATLNSALGLQSTASLDPANWSDISAGLTSTFPTISQHSVSGVTYDVYVLTLILNPSVASGFYRVKSTVSAIGATTLEIKNCTLIYNGHPLNIITQVVDGVTYEVLGNVIP